MKARCIFELKLLPWKSSTSPVVADFMNYFSVHLEYYSVKASPYLPEVLLNGYFGQFKS